MTVNSLSNQIKPTTGQKNAPEAEKPADTYTPSDNWRLGAFAGEGALVVAGLGLLAAPALAGAALGGAGVGAAAAGGAVLDHFFPAEADEPKHSGAVALGVLGGIGAVMGAPAVLATAAVLGTCGLLLSFVDTH